MRRIHVVSLCHDFSNLFAKANNMAEFTGHELDGVQQLVKIENTYLSRKKSQETYSCRTVRAQCRKVREHLFIEIKRQEQLKERIGTLLRNKPTNSNARKLKFMQSRCWWEMKHRNWILRQMKVVEYIRSTKDVWEGCEEYVRILSRSCLRKPAQTHVESLISIIGNQNRGQ